AVEPCGRLLEVVAGADPDGDVADAGADRHAVDRLRLAQTEQVPDAAGELELRDHQVAGADERTDLRTCHVGEVAAGDGQHELQVGAHDDLLVRRVAATA